MLLTGGRRGAWGEHGYEGKGLWAGRGMGQEGVETVGRGGGGGGGVGGGRGDHIICLNVRYTTSTSSRLRLHYVYS